MKKGQTGIELMFIAIMMVVGVMVLFLPTILYSFSSKINIVYEYQYDNARSLLLSIISTTVAGTTKPSLELLGEYIQLQAQQKIDSNIKLPDITPIQNELSKFATGINVDCYKLSADAVIAKSSSCEPTQYQASGNIPLPYNPDHLVKSITLVIVK